MRVTCTRMSRKIREANSFIRINIKFNIISWVFWSVLTYKKFVQYWTRRMLGSVSCYHTCHYCVIFYAHLVNLRTKNSKICFHKCYLLFLILNRQNFLIIQFECLFKLMDWGFGTATTNPWVDQCTVCSALNLDTCTLVTVTFEWLGRFQKTTISMKAN